MSRKSWRDWPANSPSQKHHSRSVRVAGVSGLTQQSLLSVSFLSRLLQCRPYWRASLLYPFKRDKRPDSAFYGSGGTIKLIQRSSSLSTFGELSCPMQPFLKQFFTGKIPSEMDSSPFSSPLPFFLWKFIFSQHANGSHFNLSSPQIMQYTSGQTYGFFSEGNYSWSTSSYGTYTAAVNTSSLIAAHSIQHAD